MANTKLQGEGGLRNYRQLLIFSHTFETFNQLLTNWMPDAVVIVMTDRSLYSASELEYTSWFNISRAWFCMPG